LLQNCDRIETELRQNWDRIGTELRHLRQNCYRIGTELRVETELRNLQMSERRQSEKKAWKTVWGDRVGRQGIETKRA
jgi:hypothetical protein